MLGAFRGPGSLALGIGHVEDQAAADLLSLSQKRHGIGSDPPGESFWKYLEKEWKKRYTIDSAKN